VVEARSPTPILVESKALQWALIADPGSWPARAAAYAPVHAELERQRQQIAGFPLLWQEGAQRWLAAPFRARADGPEFAVPAGWNVRAHDAGRWLVVYPDTGDFDARLARGTALLQEALRAMELTARGPITAQPHFHLEEAVPTADKLGAPIVRMSVPVR
jgi:hypothetical protein